MKQYQNIADRDLIFAEYFNDEQTCRKNGGQPADVSFSQGAAYGDGVNGTIQFDNRIKVSSYINGISFRFKLKFVNTGVWESFFQQGSTNGGVASLHDIDFIKTSANVLRMRLSDGASDIVNITSSFSDFTADIWYDIILTWDGTTGANGVKFYIDGELDTFADAAGTIDSVSNDHEPYIFGVPGTAFNSENYISLMELYNTALSADSIENLYNGRRYRELNVNTGGRQEIANITARSGVVECIMDNILTNTSTTVFKDGQIMVALCNGSSSVVETTLADDINTLSIWVKPRTADESIIDLGGGNTVTIASSVLTAAWADDLYVNGVAGTAIEVGQWQRITCRVDTAISLTDIDIGKISTTFYDGFWNDLSLVTGLVTDAELNQQTTSTRHLYSK